MTPTILCGIGASEHARAALDVAAALAERLRRLAGSPRATLLVVASRGRGPLRGGLRGSVSRALVRRAQRPVVSCLREESA
jgi:nucleotide-binding universal stress UspA family protein